MAAEMDEQLGSMLEARNSDDREVFVYRLTAPTEGTLMVVTNASKNWFGVERQKVKCTKSSCRHVNL